MWVTMLVCLFQKATEHDRWKSWWGGFLKLSQSRFCLFSGDKRDEIYPVYYWAEGRAWLAVCSCRAWSRWTFWTLCFSWCDKSKRLQISCKGSFVMHFAKTSLMVWVFGLMLIANLHVSCFTFHFLSVFLHFVLLTCVSGALFPSCVAVLHSSLILLHACPASASLALPVPSDLPHLISSFLVSLYLHCIPSLV